VVAAEEVVTHDVRAGAGEDVFQPEGVPGLVGDVAADLDRAFGGHLAVAGGVITDRVHEGQVVGVAVGRVLETLGDAGGVHEGEGCEGVRHLGAVPSLLLASAPTKMVVEPGLLVSYRPAPPDLQHLDVERAKMRATSFTVAEMLALRSAPGLGW